VALGVGGLDDAGTALLEPLREVVHPEVGGFVDMAIG
jgi:hypothetical protein